jgi:hypothetical protein
MVAPRGRVVVDHRVIQWLLVTSPAPPVIAHMEWVLALCSAANKARCPTWVSERLSGKSRPKGPGITWPRELPIPQRDDIGAASNGEMIERTPEGDAEGNELGALLRAWDRASPGVREKFRARVELDDGVRASAAELVDTLESQLQRDGIHAAPQLRIIRKRIEECRPVLNLETVPAVGTA